MKFRLRTLLLVTTLVCLFLGWIGKPSVVTGGRMYGHSPWKAYYFRPKIYPELLSVQFWGDNYWGLLVYPDQARTSFPHAIVWDEYGLRFQRGQ